MSKFHVVIRAASAERSLPLGISFEDLAAALESFDRLFFEPDGSFVWSGEAAAGRWQIDGSVYDLAGRVQYVDLKGSAPAAVMQQLAESVDRLLAGLATPLAGLAFDEVQSGKSLSFYEFRQRLTADGNSDTGP